LLYLNIYSGSLSFAASGRSLHRLFLELKASNIEAPQLEAKILCTLFWASARSFDTRLAEEAIGRIQELCERSTVPEVAYRTARSLGIYEVYRGRLDRAKELLTDAVNIAKELGSETQIIEAYHGLSILPHRSLSRELVRELLAVVRLAERNVDPMRAGGILCNCAVYHSYIGEFDEAEDLLNRAVKILEVADYRSDLASSIPFNLAYIAEARGDFAAAEEYWQDALRTSQEGGILPLMLETLAGLGRLQLRRGDVSQARVLAAKAARLARKGKYFVDEQFGLTRLIADLRCQSGRHEKALRDLEKTALSTAGSDIPAYFAAQYQRIEILLRRNRQGEADSIAKQLRAVANQHGASWWVSRLEALADPAQPHEA
jgi:tetratricopeptide (TPR) repeat protein